MNRAKRNALRDPRRVDRGLLTSQRDYTDLPPAAARPRPAMNWLQEAAMLTMPFPPLSDALGLAGDVQMFVEQPETRTAANFLLAALPALPVAGASYLLLRGRKRAKPAKGARK